MPAIAAGVGRTTGVTRPATPPAPVGPAVVEVVVAATPGIAAPGVAEVVVGTGRASTSPSAPPAAGLPLSALAPPATVGLMVVDVVDPALAAAAWSTVRVR